MQDHTAICTRWVGGRRRSKQEVIITLPAAALHLLTTWKNWKKFRNKPNINRCFCTRTFFASFSRCLFLRELFLSLQSERKGGKLLWRAAERRIIRSVFLRVYARVHLGVCTSCNHVRGHFCFRQTLTVWNLCSKVQMEKQMAFLSVT